MASKDLLKFVREKSVYKTNYQLARAIGVSDQVISRWERNLGVPDGMNMLNLMEVSGMTSKEAREQLMKGVPVKEAGFVDLEVLGAMSLAGVTLLPYEALFTAISTNWTLYIM